MEAEPEHDSEIDQEPGIEREPVPATSSCTKAIRRIPELIGMGLLGIACCMPFVSGVMTMAGWGPIWLKVLMAFAPSIGVVTHIKIQGDKSKEATNDPVAMGIIFLWYTVVWFPVGILVGLAFR